MADIYASPNSTKASRSSARAERLYGKTRTGNIVRVGRFIIDGGHHVLVAHVPVNVIKRMWDPGAGEGL